VPDKPEAPSRISQAVLVVLLVAAATLISWGVQLIYRPAGFITAGTLLAALAVLLLLDVGGS
jgi:hypothetical protein